MMRLTGRLSLLLLAGAAVAACDKSRPLPDGSAAERSPQTKAAAASAAAPSVPTTNPEVPDLKAPPMPSPEKTKSLARGSNAFGFDLWSRVSRKQSSNFAMSPASISMAFAMTYGGAEGETAAQMKKVLHFEEEPNEAMASWGGLARSLSVPGAPVKLRIANRLFGETTYSFERPYLDRTRLAFGAPLEEVDFKSAPESARARINGWVEEQTEKKITDLLPAGAIKPLTRLVLVNAVYFLGNWESPFDPARTRAETFVASAASQKSVPTMNQVAQLGFAEVGGVKVLEMAYKGGSTSFVAVLPQKPDGLPALQASLGSRELEGWLSALRVQSVSVSLPRFEARPSASLPLAPELEALGMKLPFDKARADFTNMGNPPNPEERLSIDDAFHKAFVKVDETGTEAAAATAVVMAARGGMPAKPVEFKADHPFLFFIVDKASGLVLFMGSVVDP